MFYQLRNYQFLKDIKDYRNRQPWKVNMLESFCFSETKYFRFSQCLLTRTMKKLENKHTFFHILSPCFIIDAFVLYSVTPQLPQRLPLVIFIMASLFLSLLIFFYYYYLCSWLAKCYCCDYHFFSFNSSAFICFYYYSHFLLLDRTVPEYLHVWECEVTRV